MMRFEHPLALWLLLALPVLLFLAFRDASRPRRLLAAWGGAATIKRILPGWSFARSLFKGLLSTTGLGLCILALAGPQVGTRQIEIERKGVDVVVAVDVSQSMAAQDLAPDRMARARHSIRQLLGKMQGDRVALLPFAGSTFLQHPLTSDYALAGLMTDLLKPGLIPVAGTDLGGAIRRALQVYQETAPGQRVLIIISDGEDLVGDWESALIEARDAGVMIHTVGMASPEGAPVPDPDRPGAYKLDRSGSIVLSRLDETVLQRLAADGGGMYLRSTSGGDELVKILDRIGELEGRDLGSRMYAGWQERYAALLLPGLILTLLGWWWPGAGRSEQVGTGRGPRQAPARGFARFMLSLALLAVALPAHADLVGKNNRALKAYQKSDFGGAAQGFGDALGMKEHPQTRFNLGDALFKSGDLQGAAAQYRRVADPVSGADPALTAQAFANLGRVLLDQNQLEPACQALEEALARRPDLAEARHNLELALRRQEQGQQEGQGQDKRDQKSQDKQDKQDQQGQQQQDQEGEQQQDQQGQQKQQDGQDKQDQQGQEGQQGQQDEQTQPQDSTGAAQARRIDPDQLQQLLNSVSAQERESLSRKLEKLPGQGRRVEKDW